MVTSNEMTMTDGDRLLRRILECPEDDAPRLIYSDWLEEQGEDERARFIRFQIKVARWNCTFAQTTEQPGWKHNCGTDDKGFWLCQPIRSKCREMFEKHKCEWFGESLAILYMEDEGEDADGQYEGLNKAFIGRGFVSSVSLTCEAFVGGPCPRCNGSGLSEREYHGVVDNDGGCGRCGGTGRIEGVARELFQRHPIVDVKLVDKKPRQADRLDYAGTSFDWWRHDTRNPPDSSDLPAVLFNFFRGEQRHHYGSIIELIEFDTEASANAAASCACVAYGRRLAGLPPLTPAQSPPAGT
jgi:uncharacterized protein (TIGR02996 family)